MTYLLDLAGLRTVIDGDGEELVASSVVEIGEGISASYNQSTRRVVLSAAVKTNLTATTDPTTGDDSDDGYVVGSRWINTTTGTEFVATDVTEGAAVWAQTTNALPSPLLSRRYSGTQDTTDDTATTFLSLSASHIPVETTAIVIVHAIARSKDDTSGNGHQTRRLTVRRESTDTVTLETDEDPYGVVGDSEALTYAGLTATQNSDVIDLKVAGAAATNVRWGWIVDIAGVTYERSA